MMKQVFAISAWFAAVFFALLSSGCSESAPESRVAVIEAMQKKLERITDTATADAAAESYIALASSVDSFPEVSQAEAEHAEIVVGAWIGEIHRLEKANFYDSEALKKALNLQ